MHSGLFGSLVFGVYTIGGRQSASPRHGSAANRFITDRIDTTFEAKRGVLSLTPFLERGTR